MFRCNRLQPITANYSLLYRGVSRVGNHDRLSFLMSVIKKDCVYLVVRRSATMEPFSHSDVQPFNHSTMEPWSRSTMEPFNHGAMEPFNHADVQMS
jgi:hypothetical protein